MRTTRLLFLTAWILVLCAGQLSAQPLSIDIYGPGQGKMNLTLTRPLPIEGTPSTPAEAKDLQDLINRNLSFMPFLNMVQATSVLGGDNPGGVKAEQIDFARFKKSTVDVMVTTGWLAGSGLGTVELRAYGVYNGQLIVGKQYVSVTREQLPVIANRFCSALLEALTGKAGFFDSMLAFVKRSGSGKEIWVVSPMGEGLRQVTSLRGLSMSPAWSPDGRHIAFTHVGPTEHTLGVWDAGSGATRTVKLPGQSVISPAYMPDGRIAVAIDQGGNPDIVALTSSFQVQSKLAASWAIDVSPSFDESGRKMAFVSSRLGNPHIFLADLASGEVKRVSTEGKYNTNPCLSPDGKLIVYTRQYPEGHRVILYDVASGSEKVLTHGPGSDEKPTFSPDGYFIAYTSSRAGGFKLYLTTKNGEQPIQIPTGDGEATAPAWSWRAKEGG